MAKDDAPIRPIRLGNMRQNGVRGLFVKDGVGQFQRSACSIYALLVTRG